MFKENFIKLCNQKNESPSSVMKKIGLTPATFSCWTDNTVPRRTTLQKIADYFNVSIDYLLGNENEKKPTANSYEQNNINLQNQTASQTKEYPWALSDEELEKIAEEIRQMSDAEWYRRHAPNFIQIDGDLIDTGETIHRITQQLPNGKKHYQYIVDTPFHTQGGMEMIIRTKFEPLYAKDPEPYEFLNLIFDYQKNVKLYTQLSAMVNKENGNKYPFQLEYVQIAEDDGTPYSITLKPADPLSKHNLEYLRKRWKARGIIK